jgi:hypothetical protein
MVSTDKLPDLAKINSKVKKFSYNAGWNHKWTQKLVNIVMIRKSEGCGVAEIADEVFEAGGPSKWENVRDLMIELFPGESIKGDCDDPSKWTWPLGRSCANT